MIKQKEIRYYDLAEFISSVGKENIISILPATFISAEAEIYPYFNRGDAQISSLIKEYIVINAE